MERPNEEIPVDKIEARLLGTEWKDGIIVRTGKKGWHKLEKCTNMYTHHATTVATKEAHGHATGGVGADFGTVAAERSKAKESASKKAICKPSGADTMMSTLAVAQKRCTVPTRPASSVQDSPRDENPDGDTNGKAASDSPGDCPVGGDPALAFGHGKAPGPFARSKAIAPAKQSAPSRAGGSGAASSRRFQRVPPSRPSAPQTSGTVAPRIAHLDGRTEALRTRIERLVGEEKSNVLGERQGI